MEKLSMKVKLNMKTQKMKEDTTDLHVDAHVAPYIIQLFIILE